jgi:hypothetical protein
MGAVSLAEKAVKERNIPVRILMPANKFSDDTILDPNENFSDGMIILNKCRIPKPHSGSG